MIFFLKRRKHSLKFRNIYALKVYKNNYFLQTLEKNGRMGKGKETRESEREQEGEAERVCCGEGSGGGEGGPQDTLHVTGTQQARVQ